MRARLSAAIRVGLIYAALLAALLTSLLVWSNRPLSFGGVAELAVIMGWIAGCLAVLQLAVFGLIGFLVGRFAGWTVERWTAFVVSGMIAANVVWLLAGLLTPSQWWYRVLTVITWTGLVESAALFAAGVLLLLGGVWLSGSQKRRGAISLGLAVLLIGACLGWNASLIEQDSRDYPLAEIRAAAGNPGADQADEVEGNQKVIILGFDGATWDLMKPLLEAGKLPNFARLIAGGSIGYLDNGNRSFSPEIWNSMFSGRRASEHRISEFRNIVLPRSGESLSRLLIVQPTPHTFLGVRQLFWKLPNPGLWELHLARTVNRPVKIIWEIASDFEKRVLVMNPITSRPVQPVNGSMIICRDSLDPYSAYPPELAEEWQEFASQGDRPRGGWRAHVGQPAKLLDRERFGAKFSAELFGREEFDLGVFFSNLVDGVSHVAWNFHARDKLFLTRLPLDLDDEEWEQLVLDNIDTVVPRAYVSLDDVVGQFLDRHDQANYIVVSDHGWSYSGFEHSASQDGILILSGPAFQSGLDLDGVTVEDITPTALGILGVPQSREFAGRVVSEALRQEPVLATVNSYGKPRFTRGVERRGIDTEELERLKALGYIR